MANDQPVALVAGVGEGLGAAIARRFARAGHPTVVVARTPDRVIRVADEITAAGGRASARGADLAEESAVIALFDAVERDIGAVGVTVFNAASWHHASVLYTAADAFEQVWRSSCYAGFLVGREAARRMAPRGAGTILFTGATASMRGGAHFSAFAAAKGGLRQVAQSMARELGPQGIHVAHFVVDGIIDTPRSRERLGDRARELPEHGMLSPAAIAEVYYQVHAQPRNAWTFELDLRPAAEKF